MTATRPLIAACAAALLAGCQLNMKPGATSIFQAFEDPHSPTELVAMSINPYDANDRYIGTLGLANMPFASEPLYIQNFVTNAASPTRGTTGHPTKTALEQYQIATDLLNAELPKLRKLYETDIHALEKQLDAAGAPPTPGRLPTQIR